MKTAAESQNGLTARHRRPRQKQQATPADVGALTHMRRESFVELAPKHRQGRGGAIDVGACQVAAIALLVRQVAKKTQLAE